MKKSAPTTLYKIIVCPVGHAPTVAEVSDPWGFTKSHVLQDPSALIEVVQLDDGVLIYCDEEARMKNLPHNHDIPATARSVEADFIIEMRDPDDPPFANPGEVGYHKVYGSFILARHDADKDVPVSLSDEDVKKYLALLNVH